MAINTAYNYGYDALGNLVRDDREGITGIDWTVAGKVRSVAKATGPSLTFGYGAGGQRILKQVGDPAHGGFREHYIRDAQGNIMAIYKYTNSGTASTKVVERPIYGSSRLGSYALAQEVMVSSLVDYPFTQLLSDVHKRYELNDHLGNVSTVVSGRLLDGAGAGSPKQAEVITASGYEPFGALLPGRNWRQPLGPPPPPVTPQGTLVITEFSNGPSGDCEYVELYVTKCALYPDATEVDIRRWIVDDNAGNFNTEGGCTTGVGISSGHLRLADVPAWASVPVGSVIVLYNGNDNCYAFTAQEAGTGGQYFVDVNSTTLIERTGSNGTPSTSDCGYCDNSYTATSSSPSSWSTIAMGNSGDGIQVRCPDCPESEAGFFHGLAYGADLGSLVAGANDLGAGHFAGTGSQRSYELTGADCTELGDAAGWTRTTAPASGTPPATAGVVDANVLAWLEECSVPCCGSFEPPVLAQKQGYRFGFNGMEKVDEMYGSTGNSYDFGARLYDPRVGRWLSLDPLVDDYPSISPYSYTNNNPILFIDPDGKKIVVYVNGEKHEYIPNTKPKSGSPDILFKLHEAISYNMKTEIGKSVWSALGETDKVVNIRFRDAVDYNDDRTNKFDPYMVNLRSDYTESLGTIFWDSDSKVMVFESKENGERGFATGYQSPSTVLLHEAGHAYIMLQALLTGVGGDEWKLYKEEGNDDLGQDKVYRNKEERKVVEEIEQPYIGQINAIEGINGSYQQSRSNSYGQVQFRDNQSNVNGGADKS